MVRYCVGDKQSDFETITEIDDLEMKVVEKIVITKKGAKYCSNAQFVKRKDPIFHPG